MSSMNSEIKDKAYHEELVREIEIKEARSLFANCKCKLDTRTVKIS